MSEKTNEVVVDTDIYNKMLAASVKLYEFIRYKETIGLPIEPEEANWANDFFAYANELNTLVEKTEG